MDKIFRFSSVKGRATPMHSHHYHDLCEIYYMVSGECIYYINDVRYEISEGDVVFIPEGVVHKTDYGKREHKRLLIECSSDYIPSPLKSTLDTTVHIPRSLGFSDELYELLTKIEVEESERKDFYTEAREALTSLLFYGIARAKNVLRDDSRRPSVKKIAAYVRQNFSSQITLASVAADNFISPEHLSRSFKQKAGKGFNEFLSEVRLEEAKKLLEADNKMSISEIAYSCGFNDSNYFSDKFKKAYGIPPLKYRKEKLK